MGIADLFLWLLVAGTLFLVLKTIFKHPALACPFLSFFIPGLGQAIYDKKWWKLPLFLFLVLFTRLLNTFLLKYFLISKNAFIGQFMFLTVGIPVLFQLINLIDAYQTGRRLTSHK
jgi:hypothetical protein